MLMEDTHFDSAHGLCNHNNISTANDMAILTAKCLEIEVFRTIVKTKIYTCAG